MKKTKHPTVKVRISKSESRKKSEIRNPNRSLYVDGMLYCGFGFVISVLIRPSDFGLRIF